MAKKQIALFGCGRFGSNHARELGKREDVEIVALVDPNFSNRSEIVRAFMKKSVPEFVSPEALFKSDMDYDAGIVATPPQYLHGIAKGLLETKKHVYVEKPFATSEDEATELVRIASDNKRILMVGANRCVYPAYRAAADAYRYEDVKGRIALVLIDGTHNKHEREEFVKIYGDKGTITVKFENGSSNAYIERKGKEEKLDLSVATNEIHSFGIEDPLSHPALVHNFAAQLSGATKINASPGYNGILSVRALYLVDESEKHENNGTSTFQYPMRLEDDLRSLPSVVNPYASIGIEL
ncbi:MAG: Gfo/Idh/MocA family oxidoreductase [Candidatus Aenigmarchaeota archaeon]|nr:Gfo/Idh/MocA family oxidoreductase [Candidatus Aenigmarchaeota archaeon]